MKLLLLLTLVVSLVSCGKSYSPLDTYIDATITRHQDSIEHKQQAQIFIDSINHK